MDAEDLRQLYARVLDRDDVRVDQSFADLGADSLSFVELAVRLGERVDPLPREWHRMPIAEIAGGACERRRWGVSVDTTVILRAVGTVLIVGSHVELFRPEWLLFGKGGVVTRSSGGSRYPSKK